MRKIVPLTRGGQMSLPAEIRNRWHAGELWIRDHGDHIEVWPWPEDPVAWVQERMKEFGLPEGVTSDSLREQVRQENAEAEERKFGSQYGHHRVAE